MNPERSLQVGVASVSRFHMFDLARQMVRLGQTVTVFTGYPRSKVDSDLRPLAATRSRWTVLSRLRQLAPLPPVSNKWTNRIFTDFGAWLGRTVSRMNLDVLDAMDGTGLEAGRIMRGRGRVWLCNRASTHVLTQKELLESEHARWKQALPRSAFDEAGVARCLEEYAGATAVVVPSQFVKRSFVERGFHPDSVQVCPFGVDLSAFRPEPKTDSTFRVLFVGAQSIRKGIGYLFEAVRPLVRAGSVELWLIGSVTEDGKSIVERNADLFCTKGTQPRSRLSWFYSQGSVLVLPSIEEGLAYVQAQAMACGLPVIATPNTGAEDLFTDGAEGFIVPIRDPQAIRDRIQWMLDNATRRQEMSAAAIRRVRTLGGWNAYGKRCLAVYRQITGSRAGSTAASGAAI